MREGAAALTVFRGVTVVELPTGVAGAMAGMLLADHGADVIKVEPPDPELFVGMSSIFESRPVWDRGKRSIVVNPADRDAMDSLAGLIRRSDVLIGGDGSAPYGGADLAEGDDTGGLVRCCITGYGKGSRWSQRPAYDALVAARMGLPWDQRGYVGGAPAFISGVDEAHDGCDLPPGADQMGRAADSPVFFALPWPSIGACLLAVTGISAALFVRERTGRGQGVETSLLQGGLLSTVPTWQRVPNPLAPGYRLAYFDRRHPKGLFRCGDGHWLHQWAPFEHDFVQAAAAGPTLRMPEEVPVGRRRPPGDYEVEIAFELEQYRLTASAFARFDRDAWVELFAAAGKAAQPVRSPEEGLSDPVSLAEGCVATVDDDAGRTLQVGEVYRLSECPTGIGRRAPLPGEHSAEVLAARQTAPPPSVRPDAAVPGAALEGITVLDLGVAMAGPYGAQVLGDLGAEVIKVHNIAERTSRVTSPVLGCHRGKRSIAVDLKSSDGQAVLHALARRADVVHHNLRTGVAERLGADYETLSRLNPRLVYCHTRGFEPSGPRAGLPGNDQVGQALAGTWYEMGAGHLGGAPIWHPSALGDFGNGVASAIAVMHALYHRERTGRGQMVDTSILNVGLLYNSYTHVPAGGGAPSRAHVGADLLGMSGLCRLYRCRTGWLCLLAPAEAHWVGLKAAAQDARLEDPAFATVGSRADHDARLTEVLGEIFATAGAEEWAERLQTCGVPAEVVDRDFPRRLFDDPEMVDREWVVARPHPIYGVVEQAGRLVELSDTPGSIGAAAPLVGQHTRDILRSLGHTNGAIDDLIARGVVAEAVSTPFATVAVEQS